jgi:hypothetical protein
MLDSPLLHTSARLLSLEIAIAAGLVPTGILVRGVRVVRLIGVTLLDPLFVTIASVLSEDITTLTGVVPTAIGLMAVSVAISIGVTVLSF